MNHDWSMNRDYAMSRATTDGEQQLVLSIAQCNIIRAALIELDRAWSRGTANSGFSEEASDLLRGPMGPWPHESEVNRLREKIEKPGTAICLQRF